MIAVRVRTIRPLSPTLRHVVLESAVGGPLPPGPPGAHVVLSLETPGGVRRNAYSLIASHQGYEIVVRRVERSRGGSAFLHEAISVGQVLQASLPQNLFPIPWHARRHLLIAGGIGVTPFLSYLPALSRAGRLVALHQFCRFEDGTAFADLLAPHAPLVTLHARMPPNPAALLAEQALGTHVSVCGPEPFMDLVQAAARMLGWPDSKLHRESFGGSAGGTPFTAILRSSGLQVEVRDDVSLLEALEDAGLQPAYQCRGGVCGQCRVAVLDGVPDHRDAVLDPQEQARGDTMMLCVSRALTPSIVLDL